MSMGCKVQVATLPHPFVDTAIVRECGSTLPPPISRRRHPPLPFTVRIKLPPLTNLVASGGGARRPLLSAFPASRLSALPRPRCFSPLAALPAGCLSALPRPRCCPLCRLPLCPPPALVAVLPASRLPALVVESSTVVCFGFDSEIWNGWQSH